MILQSKFVVREVKVNTDSNFEKIVDDFLHFEKQKNVVLNLEDLDNALFIYPTEEEQKILKFKKIKGIYYVVFEQEVKQPLLSRIYKIDDLLYFFGKNIININGKKLQIEEGNYELFVKNGLLDVKLK